MTDSFNKYVLLISIILIIFLLNSCGELGDIFDDIIFSKKRDTGIITISGNNTVTTEFLVFEGSTVVFDSDSNSSTGIIFTGGGKLVARGTKVKPITFQFRQGYGRGKLIFRETADNNSEIEYCIFDGIPVEIENSVTIQGCLFKNSYIYVSRNCKASIQYNNFINSYIQDGKTLPGFDADIKFNSFTNGYSAIVTSIASPNITQNNISNTASYAVVGPSDFFATIDSNYIAYCNGKLSADISGDQSYHITYIHPSSSAVAGTGCDLW
jgi:hypothetical protein